MKKNYKAICLIVLIIVILTVALSFIGCGNETRYNYVSTTMSDNAIFDLSSIYDTLYRGSYIIVSDDCIQWIIDDTNNIMKCEKNGEKVRLGGEYVDRMTRELFGNTSYIDMYGQQNGENYSIVIFEKLGDVYIEITMNFEKA